MFNFYSYMLICVYYKNQCSEQFQKQSWVAEILLQKPNPEIDHFTAHSLRSVGGG